MVDVSVNPRYWKLLLVVGALLFGIAYTQAPLYYSNQHQYFLHGLAAGGRNISSMIGSPILSIPLPYSAPLLPSPIAIST